MESSNIASTPIAFTPRMALKESIRNAPAPVVPRITPGASGGYVVSSVLAASPKQWVVNSSISSSVGKRLLLMSISAAIRNQLERVFSQSSNDIGAFALSFLTIIPPLFKMLAQLSPQSHLNIVDLS
ncbi:MAG: hypothetical protein L0H10_06570 [Comamonas sp.]|uniref:hypothetical protein n=1 Tax=Comamonas sp. TaxID=34028 RepID=UPI00264A3C4E|nr:hypothetical protein [Comamonas sp.]MDN5503471.1 hypothetical protein [Comamonas sp.]MDN5539260.1 hypothetical protein [Comamonas sp.]